MINTQKYKDWIVAPAFHDVDITGVNRRGQFFLMKENEIDVFYLCKDQEVIGRRDTYNLENFDKFFYETLEEIEEVLGEFYNEKVSVPRTEKEVV